MVKWFLLFFLSTNVYALEGKTLIYFLNGDWFYQGPVYEENSIKLKDQSEVIYRNLVKMAKNDKFNNHVIFYDPLGKGSLLNRKWVKLRIYKKGKKIFGLGLKRPEVDTGDVKFYSELKKIMKSNLGVAKAKDTLFYYYGEHFPAYGELPLDRTNIEVKSGGMIGLSKVLKLMDTIGAVDTAIFHTCYMNALDFMGPLLKRARQVLVPERAILNTSLNWEKSLKNNNFDHFLLNFMKDNNKNPNYQFINYGQEARELFSLTEELNTNISKDHWNRYLEGQRETEFVSLQNRGKEVIFLDALGDGFSQEVQLPYYDYINLVDQYLIRDNGNLDNIDDHLDKFPHLEKLKKVMSAPNL